MRRRTRKAPEIGQTSLFRKIAVDNFAGGGGASTGIELALGEPVAIAINHDPNAILMHRTNHPHTEHLQASVWDVDPVAVCQGRPVGLAWFSPDCKHFSKAKGSALVDRRIRGLAWITLLWAALVRPDVIMLENVEEFVTWGPVRKGKPVKKKAGQTFQKFISQLRDLGYEVDYRVLCAADYGTPTTRKRFVLVARCDGNPIKWPERTHAPRDSEEVKSGKLLPWVGADKIIDWSKPGYSVFASKKEIREKYGVKAVRPLAPKTMRRVIRGVDKFTIRSGTPFIVECNHGGESHVRSVEQPVNTITGHYTGGICESIMAPWTFPNTDNSVGAPASEPVHTITSAGNQILASASLMAIAQIGGGDRIRDVRDPVHTVVSKQESCLLGANLIQYHTEQGEDVRGQGMAAPLMTVDSSNRYGLACANLVEFYGNGVPLDVSQPMHTITSHDREALVLAHVQKYYGGIIGADAKEPLPTVTAVDHNALCAAHVVKFKGKEMGTACEEPLPTVTAHSGSGGFATCEAVLAKAGPGDWGHWPEIRNLLNEHCDYHLQEDEIILLVICGIPYYIADITLRMLTPRELYNAMGFVPDYIIDYDYEGNVYPKTEQVARAGNAVCPPLAEAMVRANLPDMCGSKFHTMAELNNAIAV